jgi:hypothetical protein
MRTCKTWALPAVLALSLAAPAPGSEIPNPARSNDTAAQLQLIANELAALRHEIEVLRQDLRDLAVRGAVTTVDVRSLKDRLDNIDAKVNRQDRIIAERGAFTPAAPVPVPVPVPAPATGSIVLRNFSRVAGTFTVNGTSYTVLPGASAVIERMPTGNFTYEIAADGFGLLRGSTTRTLSAGQTFYLNIDPQP